MDTFQDFKKLKEYAKKSGCKLKIYYRSNRDHDAAITEDKEITLYVCKKTTYLDRCLALIHELGHAEDQDLLGGVWDEKEQKALSKKTHSKQERLIIYRLEKRAIDRMFGIAKRLKLSIPLKRVELEQLLDEFTYYCYYKTNALPTWNQRKKVTKFYKKVLGL